MSRRAVAVIVVVLSSLTAAPALAQSTRRPDLNVFGRGFRDASQQMSVNGNLGATFYDIIERATPRVEGQDLPDHGGGLFSSASIGYRLSFPGISFDGSAGVAARYYPGVDTSVQTQYVPGAGTRLGWTFSPTDRTRVNMNSSLRYRPSYSESLLGSGGFGRFGPGTGRGGGSDPDAAFLPPDSVFAGGNYLAWSNGIGIRQELSRRWSVSADYDHRQGFVFDDDDDQDQDAVSTLAGRRDGWTQRAAARLHFRIFRNVSIRGGYRYTDSHLGDGPPRRSHDADLGLDFGFSEDATLQLTRNTTLSFGGGVSGFVDVEGRQRYRLTGDVDLTHNMGRTWSSEVSLSRGVSSDEVLFEEPVLRDRLQATLNGLVSRRVGFQAFAGASRGAVGALEGDTNHVSVTAGTAFQFALHQQMAFNVRYTYYQYRFGADVVRPAGFSDRSASQGVHAYLSLWAPIFQRRPNASR